MMRDNLLKFMTIFFARVLKGSDLGEEKVVEELDREEEVESLKQEFQLESAMDEDEIFERLTDKEEIERQRNQNTSWKILDDPDPFVFDKSADPERKFTKPLKRNSGRQKLLAGLKNKNQSAKERSKTVE